MPDCRVPCSKSKRKNTKIASRKKEKYAIPARPKTIDTQKGMKSTENSKIIKAEIRSNMPLYYTFFESDYT
jgi:hypothetical protein